MGKYLGQIPRRALLGAAGATGLGLAGGFFAGISVAQAKPLTGAVPVIDRLSVRVVTDSYFHQFAAADSVPGLQVNRPIRPPSKELPRTLLNEWGLSLHLESTQGATTRRILMDFGFSATALNNNLELLGIEPSQLDAMLLTHGHYDHFGGMVGFLQQHAGKLKKDLPFYLGGEECFCTRETGPVNSPSNFGSLDRHAIAKAGVQVVFAERASVVADHAFTTGHIPLVSFEKPMQPSRMRVGLGVDGLGCAAQSLPAEKQTLTVAPDDFQHEQATCFHLKGKGLVVLASCGHRGIVNSVRAAMQVSGIRQVHAIIGGFHLMPMPADYVKTTVAELKSLNPDFLIPMHCSGLPFYEEAKAQMPGKVPLASTGTTFTLG
jgi:7,8-dihydropterin-6-yl-methyl-4-(beta-D-ribofuranosyl)aminobenzene 5'-phosphate synthase